MADEITEGHATPSAAAQDTHISYADHRPGMVLRVIAASRFVFALAVIGTFVASVMLVVHGTVLAVQMVMHALSVGKHAEELALRTEALEMVDVYLVATVLYVISMGFYQLLIASNIPLPPWLRITSPAQLEGKLIGVLVTVMGVEALVALNSWDGSANLIAYGVTAGLVIAALAFYTWVHHKQQEDEEDEE